MIVSVGDRVRVVTPSQNSVASVGMEAIVDRISPDGGLLDNRAYFFLDSDPWPPGRPGSEEQSAIYGPGHRYGWAEQVEVIKPQVMPESWWKTSEVIRTVEVIRTTTSGYYHFNDWTNRGEPLAPPVLTDPVSGEVLSPNEALRRAFNGGQIDVEPTRIKSVTLTENADGTGEQMTLPVELDGTVKAPGHDPVHHPSHYTGMPTGIECIDVIEWMNLCRGNAIKYIWRAGQKDPAKEVEDLEKAIWYLNREIDRLKRVSA